MSEPYEPWLTFVGLINQSTLNQFFSVYSQLTAAQPSRIHLMLQSPGGSIHEGCALYNFIRHAPVPVVLYNAGNVASIATVAYLGAARRVVSPHAMFMIHRPSNGGQHVTLGSLGALTKTLASDEERMGAIVRERTRLDDNHWKHDNDLFLTAQEAVELGVATEIGDFAPPKGARIFNVVAQ